MRAKQTIITITITALFPILLLSCNKVNTVASTKQEAQDQFCFRKSMMPGLSMCSSKDSYYFFGGPQLEYLFCMDKKNMKPVILCNKPNCLHFNESDPLKKADCNALFNRTNSNLIYYNSYLFVCEPSQNRSNGFSLYQIALDGTQRKNIYTFREYPTNIIIHCGYIFFTTSDVSISSAQDDNTKPSYSRLFSIDLLNISSGPKLVYEHKGICANINELIGFGNELYFECSSYSDSTMKTGIGLLKKYNLDNRNITSIGENIGHYAICGETIVFYWIDGCNYQCNLDGSKRRKLDNIKGLVCSDNEYIICDTMFANMTGSRDDGRKLLIYDMSGKEITAFDIDELGNDLLLGSDEKYIFFPDNSKTNEFANISSLWVIDKSEINNGTAKLKKIYEYIPNKKVTGIITENN